MNKTRYEELDFLRGISILSMIIYHTVWDLVYIEGMEWPWFESAGAYIWQQSICWTFILLSGFCWSLGGKRLRRGLAVFGAGALVTAVTLIFLPEQRIVFGILTFLGTAMLCMLLAERGLRHISCIPGTVCFFLLFLLTKGVGEGYLGIGPWRLADLPDALYRLGMAGSFLGLPEASFYSSDYFPLFPWIFLFITGYFLYRLAEEKRALGRLPASLLRPRPVIRLGRYSLLVYLLHQPLLYFGLQLL